MSTFKRAILYISRKKGKTALLLLIMFALLALMLTGISINSAAKITAAHIRESIGGYFEITTDYSKMEINQYVDSEVIEEVMSYEGVKNYNAMDTIYLTTPDLLLKPARFTAEGDSKARLARFLSNTDSSLHEYFMLDILQLEAGQHILPDDERKAMVSNEFAEMNKLKPGDIISAAVTEDVVPNSEVTGKTFDFKITGIFREVNVSDAGHFTPECDLPANFIFIDESSGREIVKAVRGGAVSWYTSGAAFFVIDPKEIDSIVADVVNTDELNWDSLELTVNNSAYEKSMEPLARLEHMTGMIIFAMISIGIVLLSLVLTIWERDRIHEAGVLLSIGIGKRKIFLQHLIECVLIFAAAFIFACVLSSMLSEGIGDMLYNSAVNAQRTDQIQYENYGLAITNEPVNLNSIESIMEFNVRLHPAIFVLAGSIGVLLVVVSVCLSFLVILRKQPKDLLTVME